LPDTDFRDPVQVLTSLNAMFQMASHDGQYFTMWYGVYDALDRRLRYASAGHHPAYLLVPGSAEATPLKTPGVMLGALPDAHYRDAAAEVRAGSRLYLFSDGIFEIATRNGPWGLGDFVQMLPKQTKSGASECHRLYKAVKAACNPAPFDDDVSLMIVTFP
jgi:sigma-B regulation protein RsbU (phosphoserine phosphatase)